MKSSSESMPLDAVVTGVGGATSGPAEARILLLGWDIDASAAFRFRVKGGMVPALNIAAWHASGELPGSSSSKGVAAWGGSADGSREGI